MSVHAISWVLKHSTAEGSERLCLLVLANYADEDGLCWPGIPRIAREMRVSERTVQRSLRSLAEGGHIEIGERAAPDRRIRPDRKPNSYRLLLRGDSSVTSLANGVTSEVERGDTCVANGVTPMSPKPSLEPKENPSAASGSASQPTPDRLLDERTKATARAHLAQIRAKQRGELDEGAA